MQEILNREVTMYSSSRITAEEARELANQIDMPELLLESMYAFIRADAREGKFETMIYVSEYSMGTVEQAIIQLQEDGYEVKLSGHGWLFTRIKEFTKLHVKW